LRDAEKASLRDFEDGASVASEIRSLISLLPLILIHNNWPVSRSKEWYTRATLCDFAEAPQSEGCSKYEDPFQNGLVHLSATPADLRQGEIPP
jgi:hypothetical protein